MMAVDWEQVRGEFPALAEWTYLNTATFGQMPRRAAEAAARHFARRDELACTDFMRWFEDADRIRGRIAGFIGCQAADIAFIHNASAGLSLLMGGLDWKTGDQIVTLEDEFPNHYYYPSHLRGVGVEFVEAAWENFYQALTPRTRLVAISTVNYSTGFRAPLEEISEELRRRGILLYLDGTQSLGALRFDVGRARPDLFAVDAYKWLLSPNGAGFMYVSPELRERLAPAVIGWRSHKDWRNHENLHHGAPQFSTDAERYEGGMLPFALLYAMDAVIEMMQTIGPEQIERRAMKLACGVGEVLRRAGASLAADRGPHFDSQIVTARFDGRDARLIARELQSHKVLVAARHGNLRVSPHFYNNEADLARLAEALAETRVPARAI
ncbi:MAG TPA: aminotransferase class V-fold PLP-dependent enzyme [Bryobacteraceae bacterium]|nr:aminotransferase class V-fold PLP-dependent enzyme [Bryobacteraceae bacterium]